MYMERTKAGRKKVGAKSSRLSVRRVAVDLPGPLFDRTELVTRELSMNRSELIRIAVEQFVEAVHRTELERDLAEGYQANARRDRAIAEEFSAVDYDTF